MNAKNQQDNRIQSFMSVFSNEAIIIPDCPVDAPTENSEFDRDAVEIREYIERSMCRIELCSKEREDLECIFWWLSVY